jgi:hypothetical protein
VSFCIVSEIGTLSLAVYPWGKDALVLLGYHEGPGAGEAMTFTVFLTSAKLCLGPSGSARQYFRNSPDWCGLVSGKDFNFSKTGKIPENHGFFVKICLEF